MSHAIGGTLAPPESREAWNERTLVHAIRRLERADAERDAYRELLLWVLAHPPA